MDAPCVCDGHKVGDGVGIGVGIGVGGVGVSGALSAALTAEVEANDTW